MLARFKVIELKLGDGLAAVLLIEPERMKPTLSSSKLSNGSNDRLWIYAEQVSKSSLRQARRVIPKDLGMDASFLGKLKRVRSSRREVLATAAAAVAGDLAAITLAIKEAVSDKGSEIRTELSP